MRRFPECLVGGHSRNSPLLPVAFLLVAISQPAWAHTSLPDDHAWTTLALMLLLGAAGLWGLLLRRQGLARAAQLDRRNAEMAVLNKTLRATGSSLALSDVLDEATRGALLLSGFDDGVLCLHDSVHGMLHVGTRIDTSGRRDHANDDAVPLCGEACAAMQAELSGLAMPLLRRADADAATLPCGKARDPAIRWHAFFPLRVQQRVIGMLCLYSRREQPPEQRLLDLVQEMCAPVALMLENLQLYEQARQQAEKLEQRVAERTQALSETTLFLETLLDHTPNLIYYKDAQLRYLGSNRAAEEAFGVKRSEIIGKRVTDLEFIPAHLREAFQSEQLRLIAKGGAQRHEVALPFADGRIHHTLHLVCTFQRADGSPGGLIGEIVDITALKETEAELRRVSEQLARVFEHSIDVLCTFDAAGRFVQVSAASERLWGYRPDELIDRPGLDIMLPEDHAQAIVDMKRMRAGETVRDVINRYRHKDGRIVPVRWSGQWVEQYQSVYAVARDDSERQDLLAELRQRNDVLESQTIALRDAIDRAEAADRIKSAFLATMSHELRTPLNSIIGFTGIILQKLAGPLTEEQQKQLGMVQNSAHHLLALINDVLDISKIEAGELKVAYQAFELVDSVARVAGIVRPLAEDKKLRLDIDVSPGIGSMLGDARRVEQILFNLLGNAIKFTEVGTVTLRAEPVANFCPHPGMPGVPAMRLHVGDTGIGIKAEDIPLLFQPFRQLDSAMTRTHDGTGLGLAITHRLVMLMGGSIEVLSRWGEGSEFVVTLPLDTKATGHDNKETHLENAP